MANTTELSPIKWTGTEYMYLCLNKNKGIEYGIKKFIKKLI